MPVKKAHAVGVAAKEGVTHMLTPERRIWRLTLVVLGDGLLFALAILLVTGAVKC